MTSDTHDEVRFPIQRECPYAIPRYTPGCETKNL